MVVHGHAHVVRLAHAHGPHRGPAGLRGPAADDEDGPAGRSICPRRPSNRCERILRLFSRLDRGRLPCQLLPLRPGDEIELSREHVVTVSATSHTVPSLGFVVWERRQKLKPEYQGLPGEEIRDLRLGGTDVTSEVRTPRLAYLGDSSPAGLDACPAMYEAEVLIMEMTFVAPSHRKDKIHKFGHMHLDDLVERRDGSTTS